MSDVDERMAWVEHRVEEIRTHLKLPYIKVVIGEVKVFGITSEVVVTDSEVHSLTRVTKLDQPELRISPKALDELTDPELAHRIALALVNHVSMKQFSNRSIVIVAPFVIIALSGFVAWRIAHASFLWVIVASLVGGAAMFLVSMWLATPVRRDVHVRVIELTGDHETALAFLAHPPGEPSWIPPMLRAKNRKMQEEDYAAIVSRAKARGLLPFLGQDGQMSARSQETHESGRL